MFGRGCIKEEIIPFETMSSEKVTVGRFTVVEDQVQVRGHKQPYDYLEIREGVSILPIHDGKVVVLRQYRYPVRSWQWEVPGGFVDKGETPAEAVARELKEETGYDVKEIVSLGAFYPSFGSTNEKIHLFMAVCGMKGEDAREPGEVLSVTEVTFDEFRELVRSGEFMHGAGLAAWARYCER
ncbi:NUDIX hydrolase [Roseburia hominis]